MFDRDVTTITGSIFFGDHFFGKGRRRRHPDRTRNGGRHRCQPPLSGCIPRTASPLHPGSLSFRSEIRKTPRRRVRRNVPAMVRSAPFRGPASPGKPFIILSEPLPKQSLFKAMDCISVPDRVRFNSWESLRSVIRLSVAFLVVPLRSRPASLATALLVPAARRLHRPMIESCHERRVPPTEKMRKAAIKRVRLWISPALATSRFVAAFL